MSGILPPKVMRMLVIAMQTDHEGEAENAFRLARSLMKKESLKEQAESSDKEIIAGMFEDLLEVQESLSKTDMKWCYRLQESFKKWDSLTEKQFKVLDDIWRKNLGIGDE